MSEVSNSSQLIVTAGVKRKPRFKPGSDLNSDVRVTKVMVNDQSTEDEESFEVEFHYTISGGSAETETP